MSFEEWLSFSRLFSMVLFFLLFVGIVIWAFWPANKPRFEREARTVLDDHDETER